MYTVIEKAGKFLCYGSYGTELICERDTEQEAINSLIKYVRVFKGGYITKKDINVINAHKTPIFPLDLEVCSKEDKKLLDEIKLGNKVVYNSSDKIVKMKLTDNELDTIVKIREGDIKTINNHPFSFEYNDTLNKARGG